MTSQVSSDENYSQDMIDARVTRLSQTWERMPKKDVTDLIAVVYAYAAASQPDKSDLVIPTTESLDVIRNDLNAAITGMITETMGYFASMSRGIDPQIYNIPYSIAMDADPVTITVMQTLGTGDGTPQSWETPKNQFRGPAFDLMGGQINTDKAQQAYHDHAKDLESRYNTSEALTHLGASTGRNHASTDNPIQSIFWDAGTKGARRFVEDLPSKIGLPSKKGASLPTVKCLFDVVANSVELSQYMTGSASSLNPYLGSDLTGPVLGYKPTFSGNNRVTLKPRGQAWKNMLRRRPISTWKLVVDDLKEEPVPLNVLDDIIFSIASSNDNSYHGSAIAANCIAEVATDRTIAIDNAYESVKFYKTDITWKATATDELKSHWQESANTLAECLYTILH
ncbi:MAG: hypothetical protein TREMPRED_004521 [Tremellales sp. Tagirdzhanova-0007]|nr:MAG: hypothetical protein TREMPRED_004521 [Tremellales sp. Tagirdzhanova-0007]